MTGLAEGTILDSGEEMAALETIRRGVAVSPELKEGVRGTLALAAVASVGQVIVPVVVQQTLDHGLGAEGGPDVSFTVPAIELCAIAALGMASSHPMMTGTFQRLLRVIRAPSFRERLRPDRDDLHDSGERRMKTKRRNDRTDRGRAG